ncbi:MAG: FAD-binding oxidoreductase [Candidatus Bathyarchaeota archaeon]|nr:MAG: FAD-binding oxidoreductase [Candidatus Bathyarchaeota archaeon]
MSEYDAIVVGAGIIGLATAYHMKKTRPNDRILVIDKMSGAGQGNTAKSAAMFRSFFYSHTNLTLVDTTVEFFKHLHNQLGYDLRLKWTGYLWLFSKPQYSAIEPVLKSMSEEGLPYHIYEEEELADRLPITTKISDDEEAQKMKLKDVDRAVFIPKAGSIDIDALVKFYETEFKRLGGEVQFNTEVRRIIIEPEEPLGIPDEPFFWQDSRAAGVDTQRGRLLAKKTVIAAGVWTNMLLRDIGVYFPMEPIKRQLFSIKALKPDLRNLLTTKGFNSEGCLPFTILPDPPIYIKPALDEDAFWFSFGDHFPRAFKLEEDPQPEENFYRYGIYQVVTKYFKQFQDAHPYSSWAGQYALNTIDGQPVVFEENDLLVVGSCSGSGNMKCDAVGRIGAALYDNQAHASLFGETDFKVHDLSLTHRSVDLEKLII